MKNKPTKKEIEDKRKKKEKQLRDNKRIEKHGNS
jgi:hypothetical protein